MEELTNYNKHEFLALCKQEFEAFSNNNISRSVKRYSLREASTHAVITFKQEHNRYPKVFEFLQYVSRMFAIYSHVNTKKCAYYSYYRDEANTQIGELFKRIANGDVQKVLNFIAYDIQHGSTHTHCVKQVKSHLSEICVYPSKIYYKDFPDKLPEYVMLNPDYVKIKTTLKNNTVEENLDFKKALRKAELEKSRKETPTYEDFFEKIHGLLLEIIKKEEEKAKVSSKFEIIK